MRLPCVILPNILALQRSKDRTFLFHGALAFEDRENKLGARVSFDAAPLLYLMKKQNSLGGRMEDFNLERPPLAVAGEIYRVKRVQQRKAWGLCGSRNVDREEPCQKFSGEIVSVVKLGGEEFWNFETEMMKWQMGERP